MKISMVSRINGSEFDCEGVESEDLTRYQERPEEDIQAAR
jgi:hypothetical protein